MGAAATRGAGAFTPPDNFSHAAAREVVEGVLSRAFSRESLVAVPRSPDPRRWRSRAEFPWSRQL